MERKPDFCKLGMGSAFSSLATALPINYTHNTRLCQVKSEATLRRRPWPQTAPAFAEGRWTSAIACECAVIGAEPATASVNSLMSG